MLEVKERTALVFINSRDLGKSFEWLVVEMENVPAEAQITGAGSAVYGEGRNAYREKRKSNYAFKRTADLALRSNQPFAPQPLNAALDFAVKLGG